MPPYRRLRSRVISTLGFSTRGVSSGGLPSSSVVCWSFWTQLHLFRGMPDMSFHLKSLLFPAFTFLLFALPAFSQTTAVEGLVKDESGKLLQGAVITFERTDIKGHYTVKSDKKGHYGHYGLPMGTFNITVEVDGKVRDTMNGVRTKPGDPLTQNFDLKQTAQQQQALSKAADTGTLTK